MIQIELGILITLLLSFFGFIVGGAKVLLAQVDRRQNERDKKQEEQIAELLGQLALKSESISRIEHDLLRVAGELPRQHERDRKQTEQTQQFLTQLGKQTESVIQLERDFLRFQAELPVHYVRREDYVRGQSVIEAKLDALYSKMETVLTRGVHD